MTSDELSTLAPLDEPAVRVGNLTQLGPDDNEIPTSEMIRRLGIYLDTELSPMVHLAAREARKLAALDRLYSRRAVDLGRAALLCDQLSRGYQALAENWESAHPPRRFTDDEPF